MALLIFLPKTAKNPLFLTEMRKKHFVLFSLWLALSIVLGHNIVPHHHHDDDHEITTLPGEKHHHDDDDENVLADFFSHFAHGSYTSTATYLTSKPHEETIVKKSLFQVVLLSGSFYINCEFHVPQHPPDWGEFPSANIHLERLPSRAPPIV
jgi:hypothetical protein